VAKFDRQSEDQLERLEWQLDQIRQNVSLLAWIAIIGVTLAICGVIIAVLSTIN